MKKRETVKSNIAFNKIINEGKKVSNKFFTIFYVEKSFDKVNFGITVPKRVGNAVVRNKLKRQTRHMIDDNKFLFKNKRDYIIIVKEKCLEDSFTNKFKSLQKLIGEANEK